MPSDGWGSWQRNGRPGPIIAIGVEKKGEVSLYKRLMDDPYDENGDPYSNNDQDGSKSARVKAVLSGIQ